MLYADHGCVHAGVLAVTALTGVQEPMMPMIPGLAALLSAWNDLPSPTQRTTTGAGPNAHGHRACSLKQLIISATTNTHYVLNISIVRTPYPQDRRRTATLQNGLHRFAKLDHHRRLRRSINTKVIVNERFESVVFCAQHPLWCKVS